MTVLGTRLAIGAERHAVVQGTHLGPIPSADAAGAVPRLPLAALADGFQDAIGGHPGQVLRHPSALSALGLSPEIRHARRAHRSRPDEQCRLWDWFIAAQASSARSFAPHAGPCGIFVPMGAHGFFAFRACPDGKLSLITGRAKLGHSAGQTQHAMGLRDRPSALIAETRTACIDAHRTPPAWNRISARRLRHPGGLSRCSARKRLRKSTGPRLRSCGIPAGRSSAATAIHPGGSPTASRLRCVAPWRRASRRKACGQPRSSSSSRTRRR